MSILAEAIDLQDIELVREAIAAGEDVNECVDGLSCLRGAVSYRNLQIAEMLLAAGADPNRPAMGTTWGDMVDGTTPIYWAAHANDMPMVQLLRSYGAVTNLASAEGSTMLHNAADDGYSELLEWLLQTEAIENLETREYFECTPLCWAADKGHVECARLLIQAGADVNAADPDLCCRTPLTRAVDDGHMDVVALLLAHGADPTISGCRCHLSPLAEVRHWNRHPELLEMLEEAATRRASPAPSRPPTRRGRARRQQPVKRRAPSPPPRGS